MRKMAAIALLIFSAVASAQQPAPQGNTAPAAVSTKASDRKEVGAQLDAVRQMSPGQDSMPPLVELIGIASVSVAALQLLLFFWQLVLMRRTVNDAAASALAAKEAANAASLNAKAAIGVELPLIRTSVFGLMKLNGPIDPHDPPGGSVNTGFPEAFCCCGPIEFKNSGRSPAILESVELGWQVAAELPPVPVYNVSVSIEHLPAILPGGEVQLPYEPLIQLAGDEQAAVKNGTRWIWLYGSLHYIDFMEVRRQARFCVRYEHRPRGILNPFAFFGDCSPPRAYVRSVVTEED